MAFLRSEDKIRQLVQIVCGVSELWSSSYYSELIMQSKRERVSHSAVLWVVLWVTLGDPMDCSLSGSSVPWRNPWNSPARILEWVAIPISRVTSWSRDWTWVSCTAGSFFTIWDTREALGHAKLASIHCIHYFFTSVFCTIFPVSGISHFHFSPHLQTCLVPILP